MIRICFTEFDCGAKIGIGVQIGRKRRAVRFRNPFFMRLPKIYRLDLTRPN